MSAIAAWLAARHPAQAAALRAAVPLLEAALADGHTCLPLSELPAAIIAELRACAAVDDGVRPTPLVINAEHLAFYRHAAA